MEYTIWAAEENHLIKYLEKIENATSEEIDLAIGLFGDNAPVSILSINDSEATIIIDGILSKNGPSPIARLFGFTGTSFNQIMEAIDEINTKDDIKTVILKMDTPGGEAIGTDEVFQALRNLGSSKKLIAVNKGIVASGGFWLAVAAEEIISTSPMNITGSIGVKIAGFDVSEAMKKEGIKKVTIVSKNAPNKNMSFENKKGIELLTDLINSMENNFISRDAIGRGVTEDTVKSDFGRGGVLISHDPDNKTPDALSVGMIDSVEGIEINKTNNNKSNIKSEYLKEDKMDLKQFLAENPSAVLEVEKLKTDAFDAGVKTTKDDVIARVAKAKPILESDTYRPAMKELAIKVITGEESPTALTSAIACFDSQDEADKAKLAENENNEESPPAPPIESKPGIISDVSSFNDAVNKVNPQKEGSK